MKFEFPQFFFNHDVHNGRSKRLCSNIDSLRNYHLHKSLKTRHGINRNSFSNMQIRLLDSIVVSINYSRIKNNLSTYK